MILTTLFLQASPSEGFGGMMLPMLALLVVFYLFMILPQNRKRKKEKKFITELKKGSKKGSLLFRLLFTSKFILI